MMDRNGTVLVASILMVAALAGCHAADNYVDMKSEWNTNYFLQPTYNTKPVKVETTFDHIDAFGAMVGLADGSTWQVREADRLEVATWDRAHDVLVVPSTSADWPHTIINLSKHHNESARVRQIDASSRVARR